VAILRRFYKKLVATIHPVSLGQVRKSLVNKLWKEAANEVK
jgi:protein required for attachment to host cells